MKPNRKEPKQGQETVWNYPRPQRRAAFFMTSINLITPLLLSKEGNSSNFQDSSELFYLVFPVFPVNVGFSDYNIFFN